MRTTLATPCLWSEVTKKWLYDRLEHFFIDFKGERPDRVYMKVHGKGSEFLFHSMKSRLTSLAVSFEDRKTINRVLFHWTDTPIPSKKN